MNSDFLTFKILISGAAAACLGFAPAPVRAQAGPGKQPVARRLTVEEERQYFEIRKEALLDYARRHVDKLKEELDEWGSLAFAPPLFAPAEDPQKAPFELNGHEQLDFTKLYNEYGIANGRSFFAERTKTGTAVQYGQGGNTVTQAVRNAQLEQYQGNVERAVDGGAGNLELTRQFYSRAAAEKIEADAAGRTVNDQLAVKDAELSSARARKESREKESTAAETALEKDAKAFDEAQKAAENPVPGQNQNTLNRLRDEARKQFESSAVKANEASKALKDAQFTVEGLQAESEILTTRKGAVDRRISKATETLAQIKQDYESLLTAPINVAQAAGLTEVPGDPLAASPLSQGPGKAPNGSPSNLAGLGSGLLPENFGGGTGVFSPMARLNAAASAMAVKNILTFLGNPAAALQFEDRRVLFGVSSLSVNPGWRTRQGFKGLIDAQLTNETLEEASEETVRCILLSADYPLGLRALIARQYPRSLTAEARQFFADKAPWTYDECLANGVATGKKEPAGRMLVHAVTPMVDSQNLDLASSIARQDEIALYLAAQLAQAGAAQAGSFFTNWTRLRRKDVATRSTVAVANSFSMGAHFGFELGTRLRGVDDGDGKGNKAAQILDRQTFPVLLILGMADDDVRPQVWVSPGRVTGDRKSRPAVAHVEELRIKMSYSARWSRTKHGFWTFLKASRKPSEGYQEMMDNKASLEQLEKPITFQSGILTKADKAVYDNLVREGDGIVKALHGSSYSMILPAKWTTWHMGHQAAGIFDSTLLPDAETLSVDPAVLRFAKGKDSATVLIRGKGLRYVDLTPGKFSVLPGGFTVENPQLLGDNALAVTLRKTPDASPDAVRLKLGFRDIIPASRFPDHGVVTPPITCLTGDDTVSGPSINAWSPADLPALASGTEKDGKWAGTLQLALTGRKLSGLNPAARLLPEGTGGTALLTTDSETIGTLSVSLADAAKTGSFTVQFETRDGRTALFSAPVNYEFVP